MSKIEIDVNDLIGHYTREIATLTARAILAEARAESAEKKLAETETDMDAQ